MFRLTAMNATLWFETLTTYFTDVIIVSAPTPHFSRKRFAIVAGPLYAELSNSPTPNSIPQKSTCDPFELEPTYTATPYPEDSNSSATQAVGPMVSNAPLEASLLEFF